MEADRKRYDDEMKAWAAKQGDGSDTEEDEPAVKKKPKKDPLKPKHGKNAYNWFMEQNRERVKAANPDADYTTIVSCRALLVNALFRVFPRIEC